MKTNRDVTCPHCDTEMVTSENAVIIKCFWCEKTFGVNDKCNCGANGVDYVCDLHKPKEGE